MRHPPRRASRSGCSSEPPWSSSLLLHSQQQTNRVSVVNVMMTDLSPPLTGVPNPWCPQTPKWRQRANLAESVAAGNESDFLLSICTQLVCNQRGKMKKMSETKSLEGREISFIQLSPSLLIKRDHSITIFFVLPLWWTLEFTEICPKCCDASLYELHLQKSVLKIE